MKVVLSKEYLSEKILAALEKAALLKGWSIEQPFQDASYKINDQGDISAVVIRGLVIYPLKRKGLLFFTDRVFVLNPICQGSNISEIDIETKVIVYYKSGRSFHDIFEYDSRYQDMKLNFQNLLSSFTKELMLANS